MPVSQISFARVPFLGAMPRGVLMAGALMVGAAPLAVSGGAHAQTATADEDGVAEVVVSDKVEDAPEGSVESGYRNTTGQVGPLGKMPLKDMPYSLNVTSGELIENSNAHTVGDALKTNPTVTSIMGSNGYSSMSRMMVRGFSASDQNEMRDGLPDRSFTWVPLENVERIEVFNGLNGLLTGFGNPGGTINYVSKKPTDKPLESLTTGIYNGAVGFVHADLGGRIASTSDRVGYRLNFYHEEGDTYTEGSTQERDLVSGYFDLRLASDTKLWTDMTYQRYHATGLTPYIAPASWTSQGVPDASKFDPTKQYGQNWTYNKSEKAQAGLGLDTRLNDTFAARLGYRHNYMWRDYSHVTDIVQADGSSYAQYYTRAARSREEVNSGYAMVDANFRTFGIEHNATAGYNGTSYTFSRGWSVPGSPGVTGQLLGISSIDNPSSYADPNLDAGGKTRFNPVRWNNLLVGDLIRFDDQWSVLAGLTHAHISSSTRDWGVTPATSLTSEKHSSLSQGADTPSFGLMFKPVPAVTTYASYMELLESGGTAPATYNGVAVSNAYQVMSPNISKQYEVGAKASIGGLDVNTALFRIEKANEYTDPSDYTYKQDGLQVHQGVEVTTTGKLTDRLTFVGGFTWLDARVRDAKADTATEGKIPVNVPEWQGRAYLEYGLPFLEQVTLTGGANYYGRRPVDAENQYFLPAATTFDVGARYQSELYGHPLTVNLGLTNIFDTRYWAYWYSDGEGLMMGTPRLLSLSVKASW